ncbi:MAG: FAD-binding oxidoreductase [Leptolyngbyaceae cyanobacterium bins.349]|nr:FAD-binding oxidoreductase [Leptolyngbyaceae cyanobacterium bins.349]
MEETVAPWEAIAPIIAQIVGEPNVFTWDTLDDRWRRQIQRAIAPGQPVACLVFPGTPEELAAVITLAHQHGYPVLPGGNGSKLSWGGVVGQANGNGLIVVSTARLNRLIEHATGDLTVTMEAGMGFAELQRILAKAGQFLAIDPAYPETATIAGIVATADTGSLRQQYNSVRDMLLGITFVRADGQIAKAGGRVVKNVAGYDLMKLFTGSYGTLGILTQLTFRVYPVSPASQTVVLIGEATAIAQLSQTILPSALTPARFDLLSTGVVTHLGLGTGLGVAVQFHSIASSVQQQVSQVTALGQTLQLSVATFQEQDETALWQRLRERITQSTDEGAIACKIGIQPSQAVDLLQTHHLSLPGWYAQIHASSGLGRILIEDSSTLTSVLPQVRAICQEHRGFLSVLEAPLALKQQIDVWGYTGNGLEVMRQIKHQFDPDSRLSPHRFVGGI